jgi:hypothetical protein
VAKKKAKPKKSKSRSKTKSKKTKPAKAKVLARKKPKPKARPKLKVTLKAAPKPKAAPRKIKIVVDPADHVPGAAFQPKGKIDKLPKIVPHEEDKGLGEALGYASPPATKPVESTKINIVPDEDDRARGIAPTYESGQAARVAVRRDKPTTRSGSGTLIPDEDDNLGQHEF